jgi:hypothetical protein
MPMSLPLIGDLAVAVLLLATICYLAVLNRRLGMLRNDKAQLEKLIQGLNVAADSAQSGISELRQAADELGKELDRKVTVGHALRDDLNYLVDRGGNLADRLEGTIRARRTEATPPAPEPAKPAVSRPVVARAAAVADDKVMPIRVDAEEALAGRRAPPISRAERDLIRALGGRR